MSRFAVQLTRAAAKDLDALPPTARDQVIEDLRTLEEHPLARSPRIKRLKGFPFPLYRLRSGDSRVLYRIDATTVTAMRVIDRKDLERTLRRLRLA